MKKVFRIILFILVSVPALKAQENIQAFDTSTFSRNLGQANELVECDYITQMAIANLSQKEDVSASDWYSVKISDTWHVIGSSLIGGSLNIDKHFIVDSLYTISVFSGTCDTSRLLAAGYSLDMANRLFQVIRDTSSIYFSSLVHLNPDQTVSIWFLPALQPSGQAVYGCEWEYTFDYSGKNLLKKIFFTNKVTGVWIGQPCELWLNYRNTAAPTVGSLFFALSFRDYFTRLRIDTQKSTSTIWKDNDGNYFWSHKLK